MRKLQAKSRSLLLLTATPMQVHPVELWDLIDLLGLPDEWHRDDGIFLGYFQRASGNPSPEDLEYLASLFRSTEATFGEMTDADATQILSGVSSLKRKKVLKALRDVSAIPRKTMDADTSPRRHTIVAGCEPAASPHGPKHTRIVAGDTISPSPSAIRAKLLWR